MLKATNIPNPPRVPLARIPTPLERLNRLSERLGVDLYVKRDDLTGVELTGNKVRKLEFVLADAVHEGTDIVLTCGGAQSNHSRATAIAAARLGLRCRLILRTPDPSNPPAPEGNLLLDRLAGSEIVWITPDEYKRRDQMFTREADALRRSGLKPYVIPEGASNALGAWGYIYAAAELKQNLEKLPGGTGQRTTVIHATGSGGTTAGLILGTRLLDLNARIVGINVCDDREYFVKVIGEICGDCISRYRLNISFPKESDIEIVDGYVGLGYAQSRPEELELIRDVAREEGIFLDPVYTGKAFFGMAKELERNPKCFGERIVFLHTGGIFGLFPKAAEMAAVLS
jgi:D-cysteine desulfhydrase